MTQARKCRTAEGAAAQNRGPLSVRNVRAPRHEPEPVSGRLASIDRLVLFGAREVLPLAVLTPVDARRERERLVADLRAKRRPIPRWSYAANAHEDLRRALADAEHELAENKDPLDRVYLDRIRELALEAALCAAAGTRDVARLATARFGPPGATEALAASALAARWLRVPTPPSEDRGSSVKSDAPDPRSLLSMMREAVGRLALPFAVVASPALAPLAATGERVILVAAGRSVSEEDALRTVLHEVLGHARPRVRALGASSALFRAGTARGADDQEGRALLLEARAGFLGPRRRRQLALRHHAVEAMLEGADFADVIFRLVQTHGVHDAEAVTVAERAFRGGDGSYPGLGRERIYLSSLLRVRRRLDEAPGDDHVLACGQVSVDALDALRPYAPISPG